MLPMGTRSRSPRRSLVSNAVSASVSSYSPWTPLALQPRLWLDASDLTTITDSGGAVSEWRDKSGNGYAFTQATSTSQPTTGTVTLNSLNTIAFDGGDSLVSTAAASEWTFLHNGTKYLIAVVIKRNVAGVIGSLMNTGTSTAVVGFMMRFLNTNVWGAVVKPTTTTTSISLDVGENVTVGTSTNFRVISQMIDPATSPVSQRIAVQVDGNAVLRTNTQTGGVSSTDPASTLWIGNRAVNAAPLNGAIAEIVVVCNANVTELNRQLLHNYLNRKWTIY